MRKTVRLDILLPDFQGSGTFKRWFGFFAQALDPMNKEAKAQLVKCRELEMLG